MHNGTPDIEPDTPPDFPPLHPESRVEPSAYAQGVKTLLVRSCAGLSLAATLLSGCASQPSASRGDLRVTGTVTYRERMMLPPHSLLHVTLTDETASGGKGLIVAEESTDLGEQGPPYAFDLRMNAGAFQASHRYSVRASISSDGHPFFASMEGTPVLTEGHSHEASLIVHRATKSGT
jgi:putative lipoprotein